MKIYSKSYSNYYDVLYKDKDYKKETDFISKTILKYSKDKSRDLLSLGCGTCNYEILLAQKGFKILGLDRSSQMLHVAKKKIQLANVGSRVVVVEGDVRDFKFDKKFHNCMAMFNIVGYQTKDEDFEKMLKCINDSLEVGGLFIFDCWYMPAVLKDKPKNKVKKINTDSSTVTRITKSALDIKQNTIEINFNVIEKNKGVIVNQTEETHNVRYWSYPELRSFMAKAGFTILKTCRFMDLNSEISENDWNIFIIAKKQK